MSRDKISAIGLPDTTAELWLDETDATEAGPRAGAPVPTADTLLALAASGRQTAPIEVRTARGGVPTRDTSGAVRDVLQAAGFVWRPPGGAWRGHDPPRALSRWEPVLVDVGGAGLVSDPDCIVLESGAVCIACEHRVGATGAWQVLVRRRAGDGESWASVVVESFDADPGYRFRPTILQLPTGRLHLYRYLRRGEFSALRWWYSDDEGETWSWGGDGALDDTINDDGNDGPTRMRARYSLGQIVLVARLANLAGSAGLRQYASSDLGHHFQRIADATAAVFDSGVAPVFDVAPRPTGGFVVAVGSLVASGRTHAILIPDAYRALSLGLAIEVDDKGTRAHVAADESGALLLLSGEVGAGGVAWRAYGSTDGGQSWSTYYQGQDPTVTQGGTLNVLSTAQMTTSTALALGRGRGHLAHTWSGGSLAFGAALGMAYLGGWATLTQPIVRSSESDYDSVGWYLSAMPFGRMDDYAALSRVGSGATGYAAGANVLLATAAETEYFEIDLSALATATSSALFERNRASAWRIVAQVVSGDALGSSTRCGLSIQTADLAASGQCDISIQMAPGEWRVIDEEAGAQIGPTVTHATGADVEIIVSVEHLPQRRVRTRWRLRTSDEDRAYIDGPGGEFDLGGPDDQRVRFGILNTGSSGGTMRVAEFSAGPQIVQGGARYSPTITVDGLHARLYAGRPYAARGAYLTARRGPSWRGEVWDLSPRPDFGLLRATDDPSPRSPWRSTSTAEQKIAIRWVTQRSEVLALALRGSNVPRLTVETWNGSSWEALGTIDIARPLPYARTGSVLRPTAPAHGYLGHGSLAGGYASLSATVARRISYQPEGRWSTDGSARLHLEDVVVGDPASGTVNVVPPDALLLLDLRGIDTTAIRLTIPSAASHVAPPEAYWQIGALAARWLWPLGAEYAWGDELDEETHIEGAWTRDRQWRGVRTSPSSRRVALNFEAVSEIGIDSHPRAVAVGGSKVATQATARALASYIREVDGEVGSILYVPDAPEGLDPVIALLGRDAFVLGRITSGQVQRRSLAGSRPGSEAFDAGQLVIEEDP